MKRKRSKSKPLPLAPPALRSRKQARKVTTRFHKLTRARDEAHDKGDAERVKLLNQAIDDMGGRAEYQRASQVSTSFFSTSKWVLGYLARNGWLYGRHDDETRTKRPTRILEVGAINSELLDAASRTKFDARSGSETSKYNLQVRAIDLHSTHPGIEEADFLDIPVARLLKDRYDIIVCSMVLNSVTAPIKRGEMLSRLYHFLKPEGLCFLTFPMSCLTLSPFMDRLTFQHVLEVIGLRVLETKESPKISFFICRRPAGSQPAVSSEQLDRWTQVTAIRRGNKFTNDFSIILSQESVLGENLTYPDE